MLLIQPANIGSHAPPPSPPAVNFDDLVADAGATHHARFLASAGTTAVDVIGSIDWTITNAIEWERGALVNDANGGNSAFFDGIGVTGTYGTATNLITSDTWAILAVIQSDEVQEKYVLMCSGSANGGYSCEVEPDGVGGMWARQFTRIGGSVSAWTTGNNSVPSSDAMLLAFLQIEGQGRFIYVGTGASFDLIGSNTAQTTFDAVPAGAHYLGAWNLAGGFQTAFQGLIGEVMVWNGSVPTLSQMQEMAAKCKSVLFLEPTIDIGTATVGETKAINVGTYGNPEEDFASEALTQPSAGGGTVSSLNEGLQIIGHSVNGAYSFTGRTTRTDVLGNALTSTTSTFSYTVAGAGGGGSGAGIQIPDFAFQTHSDSVPGGAIWWDPTNGSNSNNGMSEGAAKATFAAAQTAVAAGGTIVVPGGTHVVPTLLLTKSGTSSANRITLMSKPNETVVFVHQDNADLDDLRTQTITWNLVDAGRQIWECNPGIPDGATIVNNNADRGEVTNGLAGFIRIPNGCHGKPHLQRLLWYDLNGNYVANAFHASASGANAGRFIKSGGYGGPGVFCVGNGRVRIRMQDVGAAYSGNDWPTDGRMGDLVNTSTGLWAATNGLDPNDFEIQLTRFTGDFGTSGPTMFDFSSSASWWRIKGINAVLMNKAINMGSGSSNNRFEKCTWYPQWLGVDFESNTQSNVFSRCMLLSGDNRHLSWREHKTGNYWWQHGRSAAFNAGITATNAARSTTAEYCTLFGWFDGALASVTVDTAWQFNYCAFLNFGDDGFMQRRTNGPWSFDAYRCYFAGGPPWSAETDNGIGANDSYWRFCVIDVRIPMLWTPLGETGSKQGINANGMFPIHSGGTNGPIICRKMWNCTIVHSPDSGTECMIQGTSPANHNLPTGRAHEVYNCIWALIDTQRYPDGALYDPVGFRLNCRRSAAGTHRHDYNCYFRSVPNPVSSFFAEIQFSRNSGRENFSSLAAFRASAKKTESESMYDAVSGAFSGSNGTDGHEAHGVQVDPGFVDLAGRDYRPTHGSVTSGHLNVSSSGWPNASDTHTWKGALDPNGDGTEVGPGAV